MPAPCSLVVLKPSSREGMWRHGKNVATPEVPSNVFSGTKRDSSINSLIRKSSLIKANLAGDCAGRLAVPYRTVLGSLCGADILSEILSCRINRLRTAGVLCCAIITATIIIFLRIDHYQEPGGFEEIKHFSRAGCWPGQ